MTKQTFYYYNYSFCSWSDGRSLTVQPYHAIAITTDANLTVEQMQHLLKTQQPFSEHRLPATAAAAERLPACCWHFILKNWFHSHQMWLCVGLPGCSAVVSGRWCSQSSHQFPKGTHLEAARGTSGKTSALILLPWERKVSRGFFCSSGFF